MKPKVTRGGGFRGVASYALRKDKNPDFVGGNVTGQTPRELSAEFAVGRQLRPDIERPVWHASLALPAGERLTGERWEAIANDFMDGMGFDRKNHQFFAVRHHDTDHDHIHIIASRIGLDGSVWHGQWEARKAIDLTQVLEKQHGLTQTPGYRVKDEKGLTSGEINMAVRTETMPPKKVLQGLIKDAVKGSPTAVQFAEKLVMSGVEVRANIASTGTLSGFSFGLDGYSFKGSQLGKKFGLKALKAQGVTYEQNRDREQLERFSGATAGQPANSDNIRIAVDAGDDKRPAQPVSERDRPAIEGVFIEADRPDTEQARRAPEHDREAIVGNPESGGDRHAKPDISGHEQGERSSGGGPGDDATGSVESLRRAGWGVANSGSDDQRSDGEAVGRGAAGDGEGSQRTESREDELARIDERYRRAIQEFESERKGGGTGKPESEGEQRPDRTPVVEGRDPGRVRRDVLQHVDHLHALVDRHTITPEKAREVIDAQIAQNPAPARQVGRKASTGRLSRWFSSTKAKLTKFIEKAWDYFNDAAVLSAGKGGWSPEEVRSAGFSGEILNRAEVLQAALDAKQARQQQGAQTAEVATLAEKVRMKKMTEVSQKPPDKPQEPDIQYFNDEDDEPQGPGLG